MQTVEKKNSQFLQMGRQEPNLTLVRLRTAWLIDRPPYEHLTRIEQLVQVELCWLLQVPVARSVEEGACVASQWQLEVGLDHKFRRRPCHC